jgi:hypothetical protein
VADAVSAVEWLQADRFFEVAQFALGAAHVQMMRFIDDGDARRVVAAIFEFAQPVDDDRHDLFIAYVSHNATHELLFLSGKQ